MDSDMVKREFARNAPQHTVKVVTTYHAALAAIESSTAFDLVLTDYHLPDGDGLGLLAHIRARALPFAAVMITGAGDEETAVAVMKAGADDYVIKRGDYAARLPTILEDALAHYRAQAVYGTRPLRVLYAEHNLTDVDLTRRHLAAHAPHIHLEAVTSASEALQKLPAQIPQDEYDVILLDYRLPGSNALEMLKELRQTRRLDIPIVLVTGAGSDEIALQALKLGAADYLVKNEGYLFRLPAMVENAFHQSQLRREQIALRESEARFRLALKHAPVSVAALDRDHRFLWAYNQRMMDPAAFIGKTPTDLFPPETAARMMALDRKVLETEKEANEQFLVSSGNQRLFLDVYAEPVQDTAGHVIGVGVATINLTQIKLVEDALRESEAMYRLATEAGRIATWEAIPPDMTVKSRGTIEQLIGYREGEVNDWYAVTHPEDQEKLRIMWNDILTGKLDRYDVEHRMLHKDGSIRWVLIQGQVLRNSEGRLARVVGTTQDITERKQRERELQASEDRYRDLVENSQDLICTHDLEGRILSANPWAARALGYSIETLLQMSVRDILVPRARDRFDVYLATIRREGAASGTMLIQTSTGEERVWEYNNTLRTQGVAAPIVRGMAHDVTERKQHERELEAIARVSAALRIAATRAEMLPVILDQLMVLLNSAGAVFEMLDGVSGEVVVEQARGIWAAGIGDHIPPGKGLTAQVLTTHQPYLNNDARNDPRLFRPDLIGSCNAVAGVPLVAQKQIIGLLWIARKSAITDGEMRLLTAIADIAANAIHRATLHEQMERQVEQLAALHAIDMVISSSFDLRITLNVLLEQVTTQLRVDAAMVLLLNPHLNMLEFAAGRGFRGSGITRLSLRLGENYAGIAALERRLVSVPNLAEAEHPFSQAPLTAGEGFIAYYAVPLIVKGQVKGVLEVFHRAPLNPDPDWLEFFETLARQAAIAIDNAELFNDLQRANSELILSYDTTLEGWSRALDLRDKETEGHTQRVTEVTLRLARALGMNETALVHVRRGALLHDIGKMGIPDAILLKPGALTDEEWKIMRKHPEHAYALLSPIAYLRPALDIPYCHHEKWDGTGYPRGLRDETIPLAARIFAVVDVWDALRSDRPYRKAWSEERAREHIRAEAGTHFDPRVVEMFLKMRLREM